MDRKRDPQTEANFPARRDALSAEMLATSWAVGRDTELGRVLLDVGARLGHAARGRDVYPLATDLFRATQGFDVGSSDWHQAGDLANRMMLLPLVEITVHGEGLWDTDTLADGATADRMSHQVAWIYLDVTTIAGKHTTRRYRHDQRVRILVEPSETWRNRMWK